MKSRCTRTPNRIDLSRERSFIPSMRYVALVAGLGLLLCGCTSRKASSIPPSPAQSPAESQLIVTPGTVLAARVVSVNRPGHFVVLNFPPGRTPQPGRYFNLYRVSVKTAELRISSWRDDDNVVADVISGDAQPGDEARED
jgi:hypothetical protein